MRETSFYLPVTVGRVGQALETTEEQVADCREVTVTVDALCADVTVNVATVGQELGVGQTLEVTVKIEGLCVKQITKTD